MKNREVKKLTMDELKKKAYLLKKDLFNLRFKKVNGQLEDTAKIAEIKKNFAKIITRLNNKK